MKKLILNKKKQLKSLAPFFNFSIKNRADSIAILFGVVAFSVILFRALTADLTHDEAYTYLNTGRIQNVWKIYMFRIANTHFLNSLLMSISTLFFPYNDIMVRLPNLLSALFYISISISISKHYTHRFLTFGFLIFFCFMAQYMSLGRGYGMSATFVLASLFVLKNKAKFNEPLLWVAYLIILSFYANYTALFLAITLSIYFFFFEWNKKLPPIAKKHLYWIIGLSLLAIYGFYSVTKKGKPIVGTYDKNPFEAMVMEYFDLFWPHHNFHMAWIALFFVVYVVSSIWLLARKKSPFGAILITTFSIITITSFISGKPLPYNRVILPFWPLVVISCAEILEHIVSWKKVNIKIIWTTNLVAITLLSIHYYQQLPYKKLMNQYHNQWQYPLYALKLCNERLEPHEQYYYEKDLRLNRLEKHLQKKQDSIVVSNSRIQLIKFKTLNYFKLKFNHKPPATLLQSSYYKDSVYCSSKLTRTKTQQYDYHFAIPDTTIDYITLTNKDNSFYQRVNL